MPPRHPADGHPPQVYGTTDNGGLLDIPRSGDTPHELRPADDSVAECLFYVGHHSWRDSDIRGLDSFRRSLFEVRVRDYVTLLDGSLVCQSELFGALLQALPRTSDLSPLVVYPRRIYTPCLCRMLDHACHFMSSYYELLQVQSMQYCKGYLGLEIECLLQHCYRHLYRFMQ